MSHPVSRRVRFDLDHVEDLQWNPRLPHFALAANALSLLMPSVEPYVIRAVRSGRGAMSEDRATGTNRDDVDEFCRQEAAHQGQHRAFNDRVIQQFPGTARVERSARRAYGRVERHTSDHFGRAFAAGSEAIAYSLARWVSARADMLLTGADPIVAALFVWHLAEEVEHKSVAIDVYRANGGGRLRYATATMLSLVMLAVFTWWGTVAMMANAGRLFAVHRWIQLTGWSVAVAFEILPATAASVLNGHHPDDLADPGWYAAWLDQLEPRDVVVAAEWDSVGPIPHRHAVANTALR